MECIKSVSIPEPCHQSWQQMKTTDEGRHCAHCCKTVTDFTTMSNNEIIAYVSTRNNICGRFEEVQLDSLNRNIQLQTLSGKGWWKSAAVILGLMGPVLSFKVSGQVKQQVSCTSDTTKKQSQIDTHIILGKVVPLERLKYRTITGHIADERSEAIAGAVVKTLSGSVGTMTDTCGNFDLKISLDEKQLTVSAIGYNSQSINIDNTTNTYNVDLKMREMVLGGLVVVRQSLPKRLYYRLIKRPLHDLFK